MIKKFTNSYFYRSFFSFFFSCLLFAAILGGSVSLVFYEIYDSTLKEQSAATAENVKTALENAFMNYRDVMDELNADAHVTAFMKGTQDAGEENTVLQELYLVKNSLPRKAVISVIQTKDNHWISTGTREKYPEYARYGNWGVFRKANDTKGAAVYTVAKDAILDGQDRICLAKAHRDSGHKVIGYILIEMPRSSIETLISEYGEQYNTNLMLVNRSGSVIYHSQGEVSEGLGKLGQYGELLDEIWERTENGMVWGDTYSYSRSDDLGLLILKELPSNIMSKITHAIMQAFLFGIIIIVILGIGFSALMARSVSKPVKKLKKSMERVEKGDLNTRIDLGREDEIGQLGKSFNDMTERIKELVENIDEEKHSLWVAETRSLGIQMNPHFLYNTLDLIKWNAKLGKNDEVADIVVQLGRLLRRVMNTRRDLVAVSYELEIIESFVEIQKKRYQDRLQMHVDLDEGLEEKLIPKLVLQPMVENAIIHGFANKTDTGIIRLGGRMKEGYLVFTVEDNGEGMDKETLKGLLEFRQDGTHHIGMCNVQRRAMLFGDENCGIFAASVPGEGTRIKLVLKEVEKPAGRTSDDQDYFSGR